MKIHIVTGPQRKKPRQGDRRTTKKHGEQIRVFKMVIDMRGNVIGYDCTGGSQRYEWVAIEDADKHGAAHHWTHEERLKFADVVVECGHTFKRGESTGVSSLAGLRVCGQCGIVRRAEGQNKPCRGTVRVELRQSALAASDSAEGGAA